MKQISLSKHRITSPFHIKFDVKSTAKGNFTITRKTNGTLELTSNKKVTKKEAKARKEIFQNKPSGARVKYLNLADKKGFGRKTNAQKRRGFSNPQNRNRIEDSRARSFVECRDYCGRLYHFSTDFP